MAQSGFTPISLYYTATAAAVPTAGNLVAGELALNTNDGKLYYKNSSGIVTLLAGATSGPAGGSTTQVQYNNAGVLAGITGATTNGTAMTLVAPVLGTPASGTVTNLTGTASININGTVGATTQNAGSFTSVAFPIAAVAPASMGIFNSVGTTLTTIGGSTGIFFNNAANSVTNLSILDAGNVGIGNSSPVGKLDVTQTTTNTSALVIAHSGAGGGANVNYGAQINVTGASNTNTGVYANAYGATNNYGVRIVNPPASATNWALYSDATAQSYFAGNVGIGTNLPSAKLHSYATSGTTTTLGRFEAAIGSYTGTSLIAANTLGASSTYNLFSCIADSDGDAGGPFTQFLVRGDGNVGIGTATPNVNLEVYNATSVAQRLTAGSNVFEFVNNSTENRISAIAALPLTFRTSNTEYMRIDSSGNVEIGITTAAPAKFTVSGQGGSNVWVQNNINTGTSAIVSLGFSNANGLVGYVQTSGSATSYVTSSDYRLKQHIQPMIGALAKVAQLKPVTYKWKVDGSNGQGFIAHELQEVVPDCVSGEKDATREEEYEVIPAVPAVVDAEGLETTPAVQAVKGTRIVPSYQGVDTSFLVATLTAAIQELKAIIDTQATRITALENK